MASIKKLEGKNGVSYKITVSCGQGQEAHRNGHVQAGCRSDAQKDGKSCAGLCPRI